MKEIPLSGERGCGMVTLVDDDTYEWACRFSWYLTTWGYACRDVRIRGRRNKFYLHQLILPVAAPLLVDHINQDSLDNRRENLRTATKRLNLLNSSSRKKKNHYLRGVYFKTDHFRKKPWLAAISVDGRMYNLGYFATQDEANAIYLEAVRLLQGYDPVTNEIISPAVKWSNVWTEGMWEEWKNERREQFY